VGNKDIGNISEIKMQPNNDSVLQDKEVEEIKKEGI